MNAQAMMTMVNVSDMSRSVGFYRDTLGLALRFESPEWSEFDVSGAQLALHHGAPPSDPPIQGPPIAGEAHIGFNVENLDASCAELKSKGVRFVMEPQERAGEGIRLALFLDPDGLVISLAQSSGDDAGRG